MCQHFEIMYTFKTARFTLQWAIAPDDITEALEGRLAWGDTGGTRKLARNLESGLWQAFVSRVTLVLDDTIIAEDYLGGSVYENPYDFRTERNGYFRDMVRECIAHARKTIANAPKLRAA